MVAFRRREHDFGDLIGEVLGVRDLDVDSDRLPRCDRKDCVGARSRATHVQRLALARRGEIDIRLATRLASEGYLRGRSSKVSSKNPPQRAARDRHTPPVLSAGKPGNLGSFTRAENVFEGLDRLVVSVKVESIDVYAPAIRDFF